MADTFEFDVTDADGVSHHYISTFLPYQDGKRVSMWLLAHAGSLVASAIPALIGATGEEPKEGEEASLDLSPATMESAGKEIREALLNPEAERIIDLLLGQAARDGKSLRNFAGEAYRANYWERDVAVWEMIKANRFFPSLPTSGIGGMLARVKAAG
jgi:hypothetical protein